MRKTKLFLSCIHNLKSTCATENCDTTTQWINHWLTAPLNPSSYPVSNIVKGSHSNLGTLILGEPSFIRSFPCFPQISFMDEPSFIRSFPCFPRISFMDEPSFVKSFPCFPQITFMDEPAFINMAHTNPVTGTCPADKGVLCRVATEEMMIGSVIFLFWWFYFHPTT